MKKILLTLFIFSVSIVLHSQNENPFKEFGYDVLVATSSKGEFQEFHDQTDIVEIGSVLFNRQTKEIVKVLDKDETMIDISSATAAMSIDPLCEKYYWISPYAYVANNPLKWVDLKGDSLTYYGDSQAAVNLHNNHLGGYYTTSVNSTTGLVSMAAVAGKDPRNMTSPQREYYNKMNTVINGTDGMTTINVTQNDTGVLFGDILSSTIDVGDMGKLPAGTGGFAPINSASVMIHELWEQYQIQVIPSSLGATNPNAVAHMRATMQAESRVLGVGVDWRRTALPENNPTYMIVSPTSPTDTKAKVHIRNKNIIGVSYY